MIVRVRNRCSDFDSYRAARVKSLFNVESGCDFSIDADLPIEDGAWRIGLVVGPSGSGKSSIGRRIFGPEAMYEPAWPAGVPVIDAIAPAGDFNDVTGALAAVGLGSCPSWLRPFEILSTGERFRASLARLLAESPARAVVDEFTSVVDRQIAKMGAMAFCKAWRRRAGQVVLLSCHYDIIDWCEPDWIFDTATGKYAGRGLWRRPRFDLEIHQTDWRYWPLFEPHHYLKIPKMAAARCYVGTVAGELVCHLGVASVHTGLGVEARACRLVVMPEWQGAGVGLRFLERICQWQREGDERARLPGRRIGTLFHTSHPGLAAALRRSKRWTQVSADLFGANKARSASSIARSSGRGSTGGYGGHFRAVQGFRYIGEAA